MKKFISVCRNVRKMIRTDAKSAVRTSSNWVETREWKRDVK